jgi:hypothetical protein
MPKLPLKIPIKNDFRDIYNFSPFDLLCQQSYLLFNTLNTAKQFPFFFTPYSRSRLPREIAKRYLTGGHQNVDNKKPSISVK